MSTKEAAQRLGMSELSLKMLMQQNRLPIGYYLVKPGATKGRYHIVPEQVEAYLNQKSTGIVLSDDTIDRIARRLKELMKEQI